MKLELDRKRWALFTMLTYLVPCILFSFNSYMSIRYKEIFQKYTFINEVIFVVAIVLCNLITMLLALNYGSTLKLTNLKKYFLMIASILFGIFIYIFYFVLFGFEFHVSLGHTL